MASDGVYDGVVDDGNGSNNSVIVPEGNAPSSFCPGYEFSSQPVMHSASMNTEDMSIEEIDCSDSGNTQPQQQQQLFLPPCTAISNEEEEDEEGTPRRLQVDPAVLRELQESHTRNSNNISVYGIDPATAALARHCHRGLFADQYCYPTPQCSNNAWASGAATGLRPPSPRTLQRLLAHAAATGQPIDWSMANPLNNTNSASQSIPLALTWYPEIPAGATAHPERKRPERTEASETTSSGPGEAFGQSSLLTSSTLLPPAYELQASSEAGGATVSGNGAAPAWSFPRIKRARQEEPQKELFSEEHYYYQGQYYSHDRDKAGMATSAAALVPPAPCESTEVRAADGGSVSPTLQKRRANVAKRARDGMTMNGAAAEEEDVAQRHRRTEDMM